MLIAALGICALLAMGLAPASPLGRALRRGLVEGPAAWLAGASLRSLLIVVLAAVVLAAFAVGAPELVPFIGMVDFSVCLDLMVLAIVTGGVRPIRRAVETAMVSVRRWLAGPPRSNRAPRAPRVRRQRKPPGDNDPALGWAFA